MSNKNEEKEKENDPTMQLVENYEDKQYHQTIKKDIVNLLTLLIEKIEEI